ncbi:MAG: family 43 glycosylhydrolase [Oscillospiraceae bacterium]|jgi:hypothetical protein|nr:family 43 glycosylhydrolase [Oscillospiraceae bacterium]
MALAMLCSLTVIHAPTVFAEVTPGTGVSVAATDVVMDDGTKIAETVTMRCVRTGNANIAPPAAGAEWNFDYGGNSAIAVENNEPGTTYANGNGGWIKWANVDLKGGVASYKLCIASNGTSRTFDVRISKPGEGLAAAVSLGRLTATGLATNWTARWVRYPSASIAGQNPPFIHANTNGYNPPAEDPSWATIADSKLDGICDVYYIFPNADSQFFRLSLTLKEEPSDPAGPYQGNVVLNAAPAAAASVTLQNLSTGAALAPTADGRSFANVAPGTYGYTVRSEGYDAKIGVVDVTDAHTVTAPLIKNLLLWPKPASPQDTLNLLGSSWSDINITNNNGTPSWSNGSYVEFISNNTWFKWSNVDLKGGITSWESNLASGNVGNYSLELRVAPAGSAPAGVSPNRTIPDAAQSLGVQNVAVAAGSTGWGAPGITASYPAEGNLADPIRTGLSDVYVRCGGGDFNLSRVVLHLKSDVAVPAQLYDVVIAARPYDTAVRVTSMDGNTTYQPQADGKTYSLEMGFYKYSATADGHIARVNQVFVVDKAKKIYVVLPPTGGVNNRFEAENIAAANRPGSTVQNNAQYSGGQAITLGAAADNWLTFSDIASEYSGIAEVKIRYSGVTSGYINVKANNETPKTVALDASGTIVVYMDVTDGNNAIRISAVPAGFVLDCVDVWSLTTAGSVDPSEMDEPYVWTKNPVIKSIYTADPEAHVWPINRSKLMLYPSHDRYPQSGCDRMDMYHVFSTYDLTNFEDEGEILRRADLGSWASKGTGVNASTFMWAPDAAYYDGYYYFYNPVTGTYNSMSTWETSVVRSIYPDRDFEQIPASDVQANPGKEWSGYIRDSGSTDGYSNMYDVCVRVYDDRIYMYNGASQTLWQGELKSDMVTVVGGKLTLVSTDNRTTANNQGDPGAYQRLPSYHEGPSAFRRNGIYYLVYPGGIGSVGGLGGDSFHYATATGPLGPWTYRGVFFNPHGTTTSHGSVVEFKGEYYWVYHTGNMLPNSSDQTRSVCMDKLVFDDELTFDDGTKGAIVRFTRTFDGVPGLDDVEYEKPTGVKYGPTETANDNVIWGSGVAKNKDTAAGNGGWILNNVGGGASADTAVTLTFTLEKAQRARLRFHYATTSDMPKLNLSVNNVDHNTVNFPKTGGKSFFADVEFTPRKLQTGLNTIVLGGAGAASSSQIGGSIRLNYIEVIPLDEEEPAGLEVRRSGNHVSAINYNAKDTAAVDTKLILAVYDEDGRLAYVGAEDIAAAPKRAKTVVFDADLNAFEDSTVKTFAWEPDTYVPTAHCDFTEITMHNEYELGTAPNTASR